LDELDRSARGDGKAYGNCAKWIEKIMGTNVKVKEADKEVEDLEKRFEIGDDVWRYR
jgi:hypothetical protein